MKECPIIWTKTCLFFQAFVDFLLLRKLNLAIISFTCLFVPGCFEGLGQIPILPPCIINLISSRPLSFVHTLELLEIKIFASFYKKSHVIYSNWLKT